jgi:hypothetical protein
LSSGEVAFSIAQSAEKKPRHFLKFPKHFEKFPKHFLEKNRKTVLSYGYMANLDDFTVQNSKSKSKFEKQVQNYLSYSKKRKRNQCQPQVL